MKIFIKMLGILILFIFLFYGIPCFYLESKKLGNYNINEKLIVTFQGIKGKNFILDLNTLNYTEYDGNYIPISNYTVDDLMVGKKVYDNTGEYYFKGISLYSKKGKEIYESDTYSKLWTTDGKYLISNERYIVRMFNVYLKKRIGYLSPTIIEAETGKSRQLIIYDENGNTISIEEILGYIE